MKTEPCSLAYVHDGDSCSVVVTGKLVHVRLDQIDAPELRQTYGKKAKAALVKLLAAQGLAIERNTVDKYNRTVATLWAGNGANLNLAMVDAGHAWAYVRYVRDPAFTRAMDAARVKGCGLWQAKRKPLEPWKWRQRHNIGEVIE